MSKIDEKAKNTTFSITGLTYHPNILHVYIAAASVIEFDIKHNMNYVEVVRDLCHVAPSMMEMDVYLTESADGSDMKLPQDDLRTVEAFLRRYKSQIVNFDDLLANFQ